MAVKATATITLSAVMDVESVWWYYKLQSSTLAPPPAPTTNPPPSDWTDTEPGYEDGSTNTLYFVELTVYSDGTFQYTPVSVDSSYEAAKAAWNKAHAAQESADAAQDAVEDLEERVTVAETAITQTQEEVALKATKAEVEQAQETADEAQSEAEFAKPYISATPPETAPEAGKMWVDTGVSPSVWRKWRGADVSTAREYTETASGAALLALDNGAGQIGSMAVEAGCRAKQAGTGDPSPENIRAITGRENVEIAACGKNLLPINASTSTSSGITTTSNKDGTYTVNGTSTGYGSYDIDSHFSYLISGETYTLSGGKNGVKILLTVSNADGYVRNHAVSTNGNAATFVAEDLADGEYNRIVVQCDPGTTVDNVTIYPQLEAGGAATAFEPHRPMGGGTVTPTEPLYGLPGAEDTVEVSVDGDVLVTRRTGVVEIDGDIISAYDSAFAVPDGTYAYTVSLAGSGALQEENFGGIFSHFTVIPRNATLTQRVAGTAMLGMTSTNAPQAWFFAAQETKDAFNQWLAEQYAAGTPVTLVYELAVPETEALTAVAPIAPQPGQVNILTDADALTATVHGSGWEVVNDTGDLRSGLSEVDSTLAALEEEFGILGNTVAQHAEFIVSPDKIFAQVAEASKYNEQIDALRVEIEANTNGITLRKEEIEAVGGRVSNIESGVHIDGSDIGLYSSDSPFETHVTHEGVVISENDMAMITVKENKMTSPRVHATDSLIFGADAAVAFRCVNGHFMMLRYGG